MKIYNLFPKWYYSMTVILCTFILPQNGICQYQAPQSFQQKISYIETKTSYYVVEDVESLTLLEKLKLKESNEEREVEKYIMENNDRLTRIFHVSNDCLEDWMEKPHLTVINETGIESYDEDGNLIKSIPHTSKYLELQSQLGEWRRPQFPDLSGDRMNQLISQGAVVSDLPNGGKLISNSNNNIIYNANDLYYEKQKKR